MTSATTIGTTVWSAWSNHFSASSATTGSSGTVTLIWTSWNSERLISQPETTEQTIAREARAAEQRQRQIQAEGEKRLARDRAAKLLQENLSERQRAELAEKGYFSLQTIEGKTGQRRNYQINRGRAGNVIEVDDAGKRLRKFCIHPVIACPDEDTMLAQKLWLEGREEEFRRVANVS